jgi:hypothetical protein
MVLLKRTLTYFYKIQSVVSLRTHSCLTDFQIKYKFISIEIPIAAGIKITKIVASIGGGINLQPSQFKAISKNITSPKLLEVIEVKNKIKVTSGNSKSGNWVRSNPGAGVPRINKLPVSSWESSKSVNGKIVHSFQTNSADVASVTISPNSKEWQSEISVNGSQDMVKYSQNENLLKVQHAGFTNLYIGKVSSNGKNFVFHQ